MGLDFFERFAAGAGAAVQLVTAQVEAVLHFAAVAGDVFACALLVDAIVIAGPAAADGVEALDHVAPVPVNLVSPVFGLRWWYLDTVEVEHAAVAVVAIGHAVRVVRVPGAAAVPGSPQAVAGGLAGVVKGVGVLANPGGSAIAPVRHRAEVADGVVAVALGVVLNAVVCWEGARRPRSLVA